MVGLNFKNGSISCAHLYVKMNLATKKISNPVIIIEADNGVLGVFFRRSLSYNLISI